MPGNWRGDGEDAGKGRFGEEMLSTPLPKLCDELLEPTYGRGGDVGRAWGTLSCQLNTARKGLSWLLFLSLSLLCGQLVHSSGLTFLVSKMGESNHSNEATMLNNTDNWFLGTYKTDKARTDWFDCISPAIGLG